ncbi:Tex-like N-terminal domain-containing protein [Mycoplasmopsis agalactiae]|uniref:Tex-like N-terminal domain-containing protein n=1 Tax=Mycoplasmopsis agalactiae TaxID=2110 RepID=UPI001F8E29C2|nr:Tex-like N-terminal domain-containing protein [Mycoplasmopsis agalactiae]MCE6114774.1 helix-hairpin-helix domain-containing protein [Mycoplasmopsis agalactiae]
MNISITYVANQLKLNEDQVSTVLNLLDEGATVPFIARYRKALTGGLDEEVIQEIHQMYTYNIELNKRKEAIIKILEEKKLLTAELKTKIDEVDTKAALENIYEPFKVGKKTKATEAIALGLEQLALSILEAENPRFNPYKEAEKYLNEKVQSVEFAIEQAQYIISQIVSQDVANREMVKKQIYDYGYIITKKKKNAEDEKETFHMYYDHKERVSKIPNHRVLAISRAENLKIISYNIEEFNQAKITYDLNQKYFKIKTTGKIIHASIIDSLERLILPSIIREIKSGLFARAESEAIKLFAENVETMLLFPAVKNKWVAAIDPAFVNGCKIAILDPQGNFIEKGIMYPNPPQSRTENAARTINKFLDKYPINIIVIGNGTASRETEQFIANVIKEREKTHKDLDLQFAIVSEVGASVYSASEIAIKEFPDLNVEERSAINIGRRFQDPLNELIKIDPKSIGVGQYQYDVNQKELSQALEFKVDKAVNLVGVDLNTASAEILKFVSGLNNKHVQNIIEYRSKIGKFRNREELLKVKSLGENTYEQAVGFLRIHDSNNFFDRTSIHPESYELANKIVDKLGIDLENINTEVLKNADIKSLAAEFNSNEYDVKLIIDSLINPTKDIRDEKEGYKLKKDILNLKDLKVGMILEGSVQNITDFGIFVYIGIKQAVLIHISKMKKTPTYYVAHPKDLVKTGDVVTLEIIEINKENDKIQGKLIWPES